MGEQINRAFQFPLTHGHEDIRRASVPVRLRYPSPPHVQVEEGLPEFPGRHCDVLKMLLEFSMLQSSDARHYTGPRYSAVISIFNPLVLVGCPDPFACRPERASCWNQAAERHGAPGLKGRLACACPPTPHGHPQTTKWAGTASHSILCSFTTLSCNTIQYVPLHTRK